MLLPWPVLLGLRACCQQCGESLDARHRTEGREIPVIPYNARASIFSKKFPSV